MYAVLQILQCSTSPGRLPPRGLQPSTVQSQWYAPQTKHPRRSAAESWIVITWLMCRSLRYVGSSYDQS
jgi:hypothetical protein